MKRLTSNSRNTRRDICFVCGTDLRPGQGRLVVVYYDGETKEWAPQCLDEKACYARLNRVKRALAKGRTS